jgi:peptide/nickel transport system permease protein
MLAITIIVFVLIRMAGDPTSVMLPLNAQPEDQQRLREALGLDKPYVQQYFIFLGDALQGDFGRSIRLRQPALDAALDAFPATLQLAGVSIAVLILVAIPLGVYAALNRGTVIDWLIRFVSLLGNSFPSFWLGLVLMLIFAVWLEWLPPGGKGSWKQLVLPSLTLSWYLAGPLVRVVRGSMLEVLGKDYVRTARAKGLPDRSVLWRHAFRSALLPITTYAGVIFLRLVTGAVVIETLFGWPGIGRAVVTSINFRDYPMVQTIVVLLGAIIILGNLLVDIAYYYIDPRLRRAA